MESKTVSILLGSCLELIEKNGLPYDQVEEVGPGRTNREKERWLEVGKTTFLSVFINAQKIVHMLDGFLEYDDDADQFIYDLLEVLKDFSYHASFFSIYYHSLDGLDSYGVNDNNAETLAMKRKVENQSIQGVIADKISRTFAPHLKQQARIALLNDIYLESLSVRFNLDCLVDNVPDVDYSNMVYFMKETQISSLKLQALFFKLSKCLE